MVTGIIIARNSEIIIARAITCLRKFDEIIVYDTGSVDKTREVAEMFGVKVIPAMFEKGFAEMRNRAAEQAKNDKVFFLDTDEVIDCNVVKDIERKLDIAQACCIGFKRANMYNLKEYIEEWYPDVQIRAYDRTKYKYKGDVHETLDYGKNERVISSYIILHNMHVDKDRLRLNYRFYKQVRGEGATKLEAEREVDKYLAKNKKNIKELEGS